MELINGILSFIIFLIMYIFFIPSLVACFAYLLIIPPIISFMYMYYRAKKVNNSVAIVYDLIFHLVLLFNYIIVQNSEGINDFFAGSDMIIGPSLITFIAFIILVRYFILIHRSAKEMKAVETLTEESTEVSPIHTVDLSKRTINQILNITKKF